MTDDSSDASLWPTHAAPKAVPLYEVVKRQITEAIFEGRWPPGTVLPNEIELAERFGVAVGTLRRALNDLTKEGLLARRRKTGTVVTDRTPQISLRFLLQYFRLHGLDGGLQRAVARTLKVTAGPATGEEAAGLRIAPGEEVLRIDRLRMVEGLPAMLDHYTLSPTRFPVVPREVAEMPTLIYTHLIEAGGLRISAVREKLAAEAATPEVAAELGLEPGAPILVIEETVYDQLNAPVILALHEASTARHRYVNELQ
ncbi:GntR family transcriptional regulator [Antarcticimicrobium sediminis]|uniref:GntR family transcriptional regulator n=1 Tax=Antarcticimicrobium sediminis TaxID=2546227 RepID=A0A4R5EQA8_9RHOB|nr:GntR family transcriptional regulator [Antarcticimicrobium sediminis]TDE36723.1 GntR family transcriptional regulator [Antarcticimicrobium sediminis]